MIIQETGKIDDDFYVIGSAAIPVYLLDGEVPVIFDAGITAGAFLYEAGVKEILRKREPEFLFLSHSHFDHIGSVSHFKVVWPDLKIGGSVRCSKILLKSKAVQLMRDLNFEAKNGIKKMGLAPINEKEFESFELDILVQPDQTIEIAPGFSVVVLNTPGHTWDFMSYWIPEKKILIASEAVATYENNGYLQPDFLIDFDAYIESLNRLKNLGATILCAGHYAVFTDEDAVSHISSSIKAANDYLSMVEVFLVQESGNIDQTVLRVKAEEWDIRPWPKQFESAYLLNTWQRVNTIWNRMNRD